MSSALEYEGAFFVKYNGKFGVDGTYDLMYAVADDLYGPYTPRRLAVPHGGNGTMFIDNDGRLMSTFFGNDRTAHFEPVWELSFFKPKRVRRALL
jgi:hypothetical protein